MDYTICRLCINITNTEMWKLSNDCDILCKLNSCITFNLLINESFPNHICDKCVDKIEQIYEFSTMIKETEQKLQQHFENNSLVNFFMNLSNNYIKQESENVIYAEQLDKNKDSTFDRLDEKENKFNGDLNQQLTTQPKTDSTHSISNDELIKMEDKTYDFNVTVYSSEEDNITLSSLKEEKTNNTENIESVKLRNILQNYRCLTCDNIYDTQNELRDHYKEDHTHTNNEMIKTMCTENVINGKVMYKCEKCKKVYSKKYINTHMVYHINERPFVCKLCGRTYKTVSDIMRHGIRAHSDHKMFCSYKCGFSTAYTGALKAHEEKIHKNIFKYKCDKCGKGFSVKTWYEQHQNVHNGLKPFVCDICGASFHMDKYLTTHRSSLHPQCTSISKKTLVCPQCDLKCDFANSLAIHLEKEHGVPRSSSSGKKRKTLCDYCGKILNRPEQLELHRRMHLGEKPFSCSICSKSFSRKFSLQQHAHVHAGARRLTCACDRTYTQRSALYRHQRLHHGLSRKETREQKTDI